MSIRQGRTIFVAGVLIAGVISACGAPGSPAPAGSGGATAAVPDKPAKPVTLNVLDVAGNLQLTQGMIDEFVQKNPTIISKVTYSKAPAPDLVGKIKAQQGAGRVDIGLVLTGVDGLAAGAEQGLWEQVLPKFKDRLSNMANYQEPAAKMQALAGDFGVTVTYYPSGPLIEYMPSKVANPPKTAEELLAYAKAHPGKVEYARPANSGPGRTLLMGLPYILGDKDPKDPVNGWAKTWAYLGELNKYINNYPSGTTPTMKDLANGTANIVASTTGWDINPRVLGTVPETAKVGTLEGLPLGDRRPLRRDPQGRLGGPAGGRVEAGAVHAHQGAAGQGIRRRLLLPGSGRQGCRHLHGAAEEPGRHQDVRPRRLRQADRRQPQGNPAGRQVRRGRLRQVGP